MFDMSVICKQVNKYEASVNMRQLLLTICEATKRSRIAIIAFTLIDANYIAYLTFRSYSQASITEKLFLLINPQQQSLIKCLKLFCIFIYEEESNLNSEHSS
ncbi:CLUMA_CG015925, isoform A [Clunio marinus]|uniref:CLUMA_CG015925, isoform A n=1 Tax=Clunio marinus TaxID=568069 RepID=A0A1J1IUD6_9DIPT|nr:CLUMA_CG015925, isoform A [Clunio marinus]